MSSPVIGGRLIQRHKVSFVAYGRRVDYAALRDTVDRSTEGHITVARTKVSSKYQVVIPKDVRERAKISVGQEFEVITKGGQVTLVPDKPISAMRGFVRGIRTTGFREKKDRY